MARTRKIEVDDILDAAERVVLNLGAAGLSLDAVAREAGISKTRVLYDFKSKLALLEAMMDRQYQRDNERLAALTTECQTTPNPAFFARIRLAERVPDDRDKAIAVAVSSALSSEQSLKEKIQTWIKEDEKSLAKGAKPRAAYIANLALMGFCCHEWFDLVHWSEKQRREILEDIRRIYFSFPEEDSAPTTKRTKK